MRTSFLLLISVFLACQSDDKAGNTADVPSELRDLHQEILAIHDEVMPEMSTLTNLQSQLSDHLKALRRQEPISNEQLKQTNRVLGGLNRAESAMWDWMHEFSTLDAVPDEEKAEFLNLQKSSAESMKNMVISSMENAKKFIDENPTPAIPQ